MFVANSDGSHRRQLTFPAGNELRSEDPSWSPDGGRLAVLRELDDYSTLAIVSVRSLKTRTLPVRGNIGQPAWGKPGIAYLSRSQDTLSTPFTIRIADPKTGRGRAFAFPATGYSFQSIAWSKRSDLAALEGALAYGSTAQSVALYTDTGRRTSQFQIPKRWTSCGITWSPNGTRLLLTLYRRGHINPKTRQPTPQLYAVSPDGKQWQRLPVGLSRYTFTHAEASKA